MRPSRGEMQETVVFGFASWRHASCAASERTARRPGRSYAVRDLEIRPGTPYDGPVAPGIA
jgi:hypothetical protein